MTKQPGQSAAHELIVTLMDGYVRTQLLYVAAELRLADLLAHGPRSAQDLAAAAGADHGVLNRVLRGIKLGRRLPTRLADQSVTAIGSISFLGEDFMSMNVYFVDDESSMPEPVVSRGRECCNAVPAQPADAPLDRCP